MDETEGRPDDDGPGESRPDDGPRDFEIRFPSRDAIRSGQATFKDWQMVSVAVPVMKTPIGTESCPFVSGSTARLSGMVSDRPAQSGAQPASSPGRPASSHSMAW